MKDAAYYRARRAANPGAHSGRAKRFLDAPEFIAWDGEGVTIEEPSGWAKGEFDGAIEALAAQILEASEIAQAPFWDALADNGGKIVPHMIRVRNRWKLRGEFVDIPAGLRAKNTLRPYDGNAFGNVDKIAEGVRARIGEDVTDSDVTEFFSSQKKMTHKRAREAAAAQLEEHRPNYGRHIYTLLANSKGEYIECAQGLRSRDCLEFLAEGAIKYPKARHVIFAGGYDVNMMLPRDLSFSEYGVTHEGKVALARLWSGDERGDLFTVQGKRFWLGYRPRKLFTVSMQNYGGRYVLDTAGQARRNNTKPMRLWDVWGFFQASFVRALKEWFTAAELRAIVPELAEIEAMKKARSSFNDVPAERIRAYCFAECRALVALMEKLGSCLRECDLHPQRWDGVGAIGAALLRKYGVQECVQEMPPQVNAGAAIAYAGGRIEQMRLGYTAVDVADIRSAYPSVEAELPDLRAAWVPGYDAQGFSLARVEFDFPRDLPWYPLFYRTPKGAILFPSMGAGIYWRPEIEAARAFVKLFGGDLRITDGWTLDDDGRRPFEFVRDLYDRRAEWKKQKRPAQNILRLGLNSIYGKTAQRLGAGDKEPPYFSLAWCGWITSVTRARLVHAGLHDATAVVSFSTDGIHSSRPLGIVTPEAIMGTWEHKGAGELVSAQAGVYWQNVGKGWDPKYRGFSREGMETPAPVLDAWATHRWNVEVHSERFVTLGAALQGDAAWEAWQTWQRVPRLLDLTGKSAKRMPAERRTEPHRNLVLLRPAWNITYDTQKLLSSPYRRAIVKPLDEDPSTVMA